MCYSYMYLKKCRCKIPSNFSPTISEMKIPSDNKPHPTPDTPPPPSPPTVVGLSMLEGCCRGTSGIVFPYGDGSWRRQSAATSARFASTGQLPPRLRYQYKEQSCTCANFGPRALARYSQHHVTVRARKVKFIVLSSFRVLLL